MLGICNGFQALIKLGLLPYGEIRDLSPADPTLTFNTLGRHVSRMVYTRVTSVKSPWLVGCEAGTVHAVPVSHGEGRFFADEETVRRLAENGQIATSTSRRRECRPAISCGTPTVRSAGWKASPRPMAGFSARWATANGRGPICTKMSREKRISASLRAAWPISGKLPRPAGFRRPFGVDTFAGPP